jgi:hypothetical protein
MIIGALEQIGVEQGCGAAGIPCHRLDSRPEVEAFVKSPHTLLTKDIDGRTDSVDGFLVYLLG